MKILVFDNYDSFTYNLVHLLAKITHLTIDVYRNDELPIEKVAQYDKIILSPGPGIPSEAGMLLELIKTYAPTKSILGVCLGHQAIGESFGATLSNLSTVYHGLALPIYTNRMAKSNLFKGLPPEIVVGRYHSWVVDEKGFPADLEITAKDGNGYIMGLQHKKFDIQGVQFHPESILTPDGEKMMRNWVEG
ncbi:MAG: aminodeoxychorismate/anthranilate synthase component II [Sediminibacterium sp.]|nr:aminodeoxychorismate/anthranilate synthase component II [Sediminibacterium sp.]